MMMRVSDEKRMSLGWMRKVEVAVIGCKHTGLHSNSWGSVAAVVYIFGLEMSSKTVRWKSRLVMHYPHSSDRRLSTAEEVEALDSMNLGSERGAVRFAQSGDKLQGCSFGSPRLQPPSMRCFAAGYTAAVVEVVGLRTAGDCMLVERLVLHLPHALDSSWQTQHWCRT